MRILATVLIMFSCVLSACTTGEDDAAQLTIPLTMDSPEGVWQVAGTLTIAGPRGTQVVDLGAIPDALDLSLRPGNYVITLDPWTLTLDGEPVEASLISANPMRVRLRPRDQTELHLRFVTGRLLVDFSVNQSAHWFMGTFVPGMPGGPCQGTVPADGLLAGTGPIDFLVIGQSLELVGEGQGIRDWIIRDAQVEFTSTSDLEPLMDAMSNYTARIQAGPSSSGRTYVSIEVADGGFTFTQETEELVLEAGGPVLAPFDGPPLATPTGCASLYDLAGNFADGATTFEYGELQ